MKRKRAIDLLCKLRGVVITFLPENWHKNFIEALDMAIASLETDEAYQLEYEKPSEYKAEDCISRKDVIELVEGWWIGHTKEDDLSTEIKKMPSVYPKSNFEEIPTITIPVEDYLKLLEGKQEPKTFKWCTDCKEYDQEKHCCHRWSKVIRDTVEEMKQEYIEREVLDKIRAEIEPTRKMYLDMNDIDWLNGCDYVLSLIDKYKAEVEPQESEEEE